MHLHILGPNGTFSHQAALTCFPGAELTLCPNMDILFETIEQEDAMGFVPIENSLHGPVDEVFDLLSRRMGRIKIWKTYEQRIEHAFGAQDPSAVTMIASHPQALAQCRTYIHEQYPEAERFPVSSTAYAVDMALADASIGAIGTVQSMQEQELPIIAEHIAADENTTRFAIIAHNDPYPEHARTQMSILLHPTEDRPGLLHDLLMPFKIYDVNLTRLESRPTGKRLGDYNFFIDFFGRTEDARVQKALGEIESIAQVIVLGEW